MDNNRFALTVKYMMDARGLTQTDVATATGLAQSSISNLLNNKCVPSKKVIRRISEYLGIDENIHVPNNARKEFAKKLEQFVVNNRLSINELARQIGVSRQTVSSYINGYTLPKKNVLEKICNMLNVSSETLLPKQQTIDESISMSELLAQSGIERGVYDSPLFVNIQDALMSQIDNGVLRAVKTVGIDIDKQKLEQALSQDKKRYCEAFERGVASARGTTVLSCVTCDDYTCRKCGGFFPENSSLDFNFCPRCGALIVKREKKDGTGL